MAVEDGRIAGVGGVTDTGLVTLNYVSPEARLRGVSRAMMAALERRARERGNRECTLVSTATARRFYLACGYLETGRPTASTAPNRASPCARRWCRRQHNE